MVLDDENMEITIESKRNDIIKLAGWSEQKWLSVTNAYFRNPKSAFIEKGRERALKRRLGTRVEW